MKLEHADPSSADVEFLEDRLYEFNSAATGIDDGEALAVFARGERGELLAAAAGHTWGGTCEIRQLWVKDELRRRGIGSRLLQEAEAEARQRGCSQLVLNTHSFQAPEFYEKLGYSRVAEIADYPHGHAQILMRKAL